MRGHVWTAVVSMTVMLWSGAPPAKAGVAMGGENCGKPVKVTARLVKSLAAADDAFPGRGRLPPFLLATKRGEFEATQYLFVKRDGRWRGWVYATNAPAEALHVAPRYGSAVMFAMWGVEGPGKAYTVLTTRDGFRSVQCNRLPSPPEPKDDQFAYTIDYMSIMDFRADASGRAAILGETIWNGTQQPVRYMSSARLGGDWATPKQTKTRDLSGGVFTPLKSSSEKRLMMDLRRSAGLRR